MGIIHSVLIFGSIQNQLCVRQCLKRSEDAQEFFFGCHLSVAAPRFNECKTIIYFHHFICQKVPLLVHRLLMPQNYKFELNPFMYLLTDAENIIIIMKRYLFIFSYAAETDLQPRILYSVLIFVQTSCTTLTAVHRMSDHRHFNGVGFMWINTSNVWWKPTFFPPFIRFAVDSDMNAPTHTQMDAGNLVIKSEFEAYTPHIECACTLARQAHHLTVIYLHIKWIFIGCSEPVNG